MTKSSLHFAHANGFPAACYNKLFRNLGRDFNIIALDKFAHNPRYPLNNNWQNQTTELLDYIKEQTHEPVIAVGHSFGALISYFAACQQPQYFKGLVMLDPPLFTGIAGHLLRFAKKSPLIDRLSPAGLAATRQRRWPKNQKLDEYFAAKRLFKDFDKDCINDYVKAAIKLKGEEFHLQFDPNIEADIFRFIPDNLHNFYGQLSVPSVLVSARTSDVCRPRFYQRFLKGNPSMQHHVVNAGSHMFPLEHPKHTASIIAHYSKEFA